MQRGGRLSRAEGRKALRCSGEEGAPCRGEEGSPVQRGGRCSRAAWRARPACDVRTGQRPRTAGRSPSSLWNVPVSKSGPHFVSFWGRTFGNGLPCSVAVVLVLSRSYEVVLDSLSEHRVMQAFISGQRAPCRPLSAKSRHLGLSAAWIYPEYRIRMKRSL